MNTAVQYLGRAGSVSFSLEARSRSAKTSSGTKLESSYVPLSR